MPASVDSQTLLEGAVYSLEQCGLLLRDANLLYRNGSYASAVALAAFAREGKYCSVSDAGRFVEMSSALTTYRTNVRITSLNPKENVWHEIHNPDLVKSITGFPYIIKSLIWRRYQTCPFGNLSRKIRFSATENVLIFAR